MTAAGQALLERLEPALAMVDAACESVVEGASASSAATLPVGLFVAAAHEVRMRLASRVRHGWPDIGLRIPSMTHAKQAAAMARGAMDPGIAWLPFEHRGYAPIPLARDRFLIALPTAYRLARQHVIPHDDLLGERLRPGCRNAGIARAISRLFSGEDPDCH